MDRQESDGALQERETWLDRLLPHVRPGRIVEFGCGSGFVLQFLSERLPGQCLVGVDRDAQRLSSAGRKSLRRVFPVRADIVDCPFSGGSFGTALFVGSLHEVFSYLGPAAVEAAFRTAHRVLTDKGVLLVQDFVRPSPRQVQLGFQNETTRARFSRFVREFRPRQVEFKATANGVRLDIGDAVEFISKYRSPTEEDWQEEMGETHFAFTEQDFRNTAQRAGFAVAQSAFLPKRSDWWADVTRDFELSFAPDYGWIHLVLAKESA